MDATFYSINDVYLMHHGIKGQRWGVRRYQNPDGSLTEEGRKRYGSLELLDKSKRKARTRAAIGIFGAGAVSSAVGSIASSDVRFYQGGLVASAILAALYKYTGNDSASFLKSGDAARKQIEQEKKDTLEKILGTHTNQFSKRRL